MITPEPPAGSEHYREGWRHGYEQAAIDRERSADAVRLVPESEVQFVLADNERMLAQHASDVAEIERLREDKRLFQDMFMSATAHNTAVCEALGLSYEAETETVVAAVQKALHPMLMLDSETGAVSLAAAVPDTGRSPDERAVSDREAVLERERLVRQKTLEHYERKIERLQAHAAELGRTLDRTAVALSESQRALRKATKAAQSGDTDRLAWISEAGETATVERQARYQETACARRPAEEHPDA